MSSYSEIIRSKSLCQDVPKTEWRKVNTKRSRISAVIMIVGVIMLMIPLFNMFHNRIRDCRLERESVQTVEMIKTALCSKMDCELKMEVTTCGGHEYIGYLFIEPLELELPIMSDWSDEKLTISPCRYYGSQTTGDIVLAAHNYAPFFGKIKQLNIGDKLYFSTVGGQTSVYAVAEILVLPPTAVYEMISSDYSLTLFTCTDNDLNRLTVRCITLDGRK